MNFRRKGGGTFLAAALFTLKDRYMPEKIEQPTIDIQKRLDDILEASAEVVEIKNRKYRITWLSHGTIRKFSHIMVSEEDGYKRNVKLVAAVLLNNPFKMMWHWLYWRWLYYVRDISEVDVACVLNAAKKKLPQEPFCLATILAIGMTDLMMTMRSEEAQSIQAGRHGAQHTP